MGGVGAVAPKPTQTELVRTQENKQGSTTSKIKETLKNIFGAKKLKPRLWRKSKRKWRAAIILINSNTLIIYRELPARKPKQSSKN